MSQLKQLKESAETITLLYVEDEPALRESVSRYLNKIFKHMDVAENGEQGLSLYQRNKYDIVITDIEMPKLNGIEMSKKIKDINPRQDILITSAYTNPEYFVEAIKVGVTGYIIKPIDFSQVNQLLTNTITKIKVFQENEIYKQNLERLVIDKTREFKALQDEKIHNYQQTLYAIVDMIDGRDSYTGGHSLRVANYAVLISKAMGYSEADNKKLFQAAMLHDLGKLATPDSILLKPGKLNLLEYNLIKEHVVDSYKLLKKIPMFQELADIVRQHHERYDGHGYPDGLKGDDIHPLARIMIVVDAFDAMTTNRIYKGRKSVADAITEIRNFSRQQFHPEVVKTAVDVLKNIEIQESISQLPKTELEKERFSYFFKDIVSDSYNRNYLDMILIRNKIAREYECIHIIYLHNFSAYNNQKGWNQGDELLKSFSFYLQTSYPHSLVFRVHGDDFIVLNAKHLDIDKEAIHKLQLLTEASISVSFEHHNLIKEDIENMNIMEQQFFSSIIDK
ncbi:MAG: response regulator [Pseudomonadota bacterium]